MENKVSMHNLLEGMLHDENATPTDLPITLIKMITNEFSDDMQIGNGGFAVVYKGLLPNGRTVAIKKLDNMIGMDENKYNQEVRCLLRLKHKNIVRFLGYCADTQGKMWGYGGKFVMADVRHRLLCFEYLPKGSLDQYISGPSDGLKWRMRYKIIKGICDGLSYLHREHIIHLDLKPANILLDDDMVPKITDFGLSRCFDENKSRTMTSKVVGTIGYLAPESFGGVVSSELDIYSLGVIIMELLTGEKGYTQVECVLESWRNILKTSSDEILLEQVRVCAEIGIKCIEQNPAKRPVIQHITDMLKKIESIDDFIEYSMSTQHQSTGTDKVKQDEMISALRLGAATSGGSDASVETDLSIWVNYRSRFQLEPSGGDNKLVKLETIPRLNSIQRSTSRTELTMLVRVTAPPGCTESSRVGVDLVAVVDVARYVKLFDVKRDIKEAMGLVVDHLGREDRLSIVTIRGSGNNKRVMQLSAMSDVNREIARNKVLELGGADSTTIDIVAAMQEAATILRERGPEEASSRMARIMVISCFKEYNMALIKHQILSEFAVEAFGLGSSHDPSYLHFMADNTAGLYSYAVGYNRRLMDALAPCIGGLTSVVATGVEINLETFQGVTISSVHSGAYQASIDPDSRSAGTIVVPDLYAGERKNFIVRLSVPAGATTDRLMAVTGIYRNPKEAPAAAIKLDSSEVMGVLRRRPTASGRRQQQAVCPEVAAELVRLELVRCVSDTVDHPDELRKLWKTISESEDGRAAATESSMLGLGRNVAAMQPGLSSYQGMAFRLSWLTSHRLQRATAKISESSWLTSKLPGSHDFRTARMEEMLHKMHGRQGLCGYIVHASQTV